MGGGRLSSARARSTRRTAGSTPSAMSASAPVPEEDIPCPPSLAAESIYSIQPRNIRTPTTPTVRHPMIQTEAETDALAFGVGTGSSSSTEPVAGSLLAMRVSRGIGGDGWLDGREAAPERSA